jgi:predicted ribosome quality control (RQC) complex YloA/Tae2 family protein
MDAVFLALWTKENAGALVARTILELVPRGPWRFALRLSDGVFVFVCLERYYPSVWLSDHPGRPRGGTPGWLAEVLTSNEIVHVGTHPGERILELSTTAGILVAELLGHRPSLAWLTPDRRIVHRHENAVRTSTRLEPGAVYAAPRAPSGTRWPGIDRRLSPVVDRRLGSGANLRHGADPSWEALVDAVHPLGPAPVFILRDERGIFLSPVEIDGTEIVGQASSINEATRVAHRIAYRHEVAEAESREFQKRVTLLTNRIERTIRACEDDLAKARDWPTLERYGSAIMAAPHLVRRGQRSVTAPDVFDENAAPITIPIDPNLPATTNASVYLKRALRGKRAIDTITARLEVLGGERLWVEERRERSKPAWSPEDLRRFEESCARHHVGGGAVTNRTKRPGAREDGRGFHPRRYRSRDGWMILVGRNNEENDWLTHRLARPDDIWLHAQGVPGSHVVLRREGRKDNPSRHTLEEAASLAAAFSKARHSGKVPVMYTAAKYVWKPRKSAPGVASCTREKTLLVAPADPSSFTRADEDTPS